MTCKTQGWFRRWGCDAAAASPGAGSGGGAGAATPGRLPAPEASDDEEGATLITPGGPAGGGGSDVSSPLVDVLTSQPDGVRAGRRAHAIQDFETSARSKTSSPLQDFETPRLRARSKTSIQDFETSARTSHRPTSPVLESILTLQSFMIPYPELCDLPADLAGGWVMISWPSSCLIS